ncbi:MAG: hypothetical protein MJZ90_05895 [Bacteroidales bacterium]|nr:hypothetical protein [Bacteroidales bacterium]
MKRLFILTIFAIVAASGLSSCGTSKKSVANEIPNNKAHIYIKRPSLVGATLVHYLELNEINLGQVKGGDCIRIDVDPGTYVLNYYNGFSMTYEKAKSNGASFTKTFSLNAGDKKFVRIVIKPVELGITCVEENGNKGFDRINNTIDFAILQKMSKSQNNSQNIQQPSNEGPQKEVQGYGDTDLENTIIRWDVQSRPQGADIFWRVVSRTPEVKSTNNKYLQTTPYEATKALDIKGLTAEAASNVSIILRCEKEGYLPQEKEYNVRMVLDQEEISAFFRLVSEGE